VRAHGRERQATCRSSPTVTSSKTTYYDYRVRVCRLSETHSEREGRGRGRMERAEEDKGGIRRPSPLLFLSSSLPPCHSAAAQLSF
jgi:hypothetical protein